jgi:hypothetical protein
MIDHFSQRANERFELRLGRKELAKIKKEVVGIINKGDGKKLKKNRVMVVVKYRGKLIYVIFDKRKNTMVTALKYE